MLKEKRYNIPISIKTSSYISDLKNKKPLIMKKNINQKTYKLKSLHYYIPPLNTDIQFTEILDKYNIADFKPISNLPISFDWRNKYPTDTEQILNKKKLIHPVENQGLCGSCWSMSTSQTISDHFVISDIVNWFPNLSTTWGLSCDKQEQCNGGNPALLLKYISKNGITTNNCIDYSWCKQNPLCYKYLNNEVDMDTLNKTIPNCGCYVNDSNRLLYYVEPSIKLLCIDDKTITSKNISDIIKTCIYTKGPVLSGIVLYANFVDGQFTYYNKGVYLENSVFDDDKVSFSNNQISNKNYSGCHAISVIGWGQEDIVTDNSGKIETVPYWYCRNTWSKTWGADNGYFKIAMYPWNKKTQIEKLVSISTSTNEKVEAGGCVIFTVNKSPLYKKIDKTNYSLKKNFDDIYYKKDDKCNNTSSCINESYQNLNIYKNYSNNKYFFFFICILSILLVLFYIKHNKQIKIDLL